MISGLNLPASSISQTKTMVLRFSKVFQDIREENKFLQTNRVHKEGGIGVRSKVEFRLPPWI